MGSARTMTSWKTRKFVSRHGGRSHDRYLDAPDGVCATYVTARCSVDLIGKEHWNATGQGFSSLVTRRAESRRLQKAYAKEKAEGADTRGHP